MGGVCFIHNYLLNSGNKMLFHRDMDFSCGKRDSYLDTLAKRLFRSHSSGSGFLIRELCVPFIIAIAFNSSSLQVG